LEDEEKKTRELQTSYEEALQRNRDLETEKHILKEQMQN
jgi:hypothetical protein